MTERSHAGVGHLSKYSPGRALALIRRQLNRKIGAVPDDIQAQIQTLSVTQLEELGEALLDFSELADLVN